MFQLVNVSDLCYNQTYKILANNYVFKGTFKGFRHEDEIKLVFEPNPDLSLEFARVENITTGFHFNRTNIIHTCPVYQFVSQNPRWKMEQRSVNMILRELIGDDHFEW